MNKKWFGFTIFMLIFSSVMTFLYFVALAISPFIMIPNFPKEIMMIAILFGIFVGTAMMYFSVKALYKSTISAQTKTDLNQQENNKI